MYKDNIVLKKKIVVYTVLMIFALIFLVGRMVYIMVIESAYYQKMADDLHERERSIKAARGEIVDRNGVVLAANKTVCTISVIHSQITDSDKVIEVLTS